MNIKKIKAPKTEQTLFLVALITIIFALLIFTTNFMERYNYFSFSALLETFVVSLGQLQTWMLIGAEMSLKFLLFYRLRGEKIGAIIYALPVIGLGYSVLLKRKKTVRMRTV